jgi:hypothetical protein
VTLQDLGDLGDFIGGLLLVVSLFYVAFQIRQNTIAQRMSAFQESVRAANDLSSLLATHPGLNALLLRARENLSALEPEERNVVSQVLSIGLRNFALNRELAEKELIPSGICEAYETNLRPFLDSPAGRTWWAENAAFFDVRFRSFLDERMKTWAAGAAAPDQVYA